MHAESINKIARVLLICGWLIFVWNENLGTNVLVKISHIFSGCFSSFYLAMLSIRVPLISGEY